MIPTREHIQRDFPILKRQVHGKPLIYLDNAATSHKPLSVIRALTKYYEEQNSNIHRGIHTLSEEGTALFEASRTKTAAFIGADDAHEIVFTRNTTEAINLVAYGWGRKFVKAGDEIIVSEMEHHSNLVPWQLLAQATGAVLKHVRVTENGTLDIADFEKLLSPKTKLVAVTAMSNMLGTITPIQEIVKKAHAQGALVLVDGAQALPHLPVSVKEWDCDFLAFSAHKMLGPTGVGVLWARKEILESMDPFMSGGDMILEVWQDRARWNDVPWKFEAGTPNIADVIAFGAALDYLTAVGMDAVRAHEQEITAYALKELLKIPDITLYGPHDPALRGAVFSFNLGRIHPHDVGTILDREGIAVRSGHHCVQPLMRKYDIWGTARASFYIYNTREEVDLLITALQKVRDFFAAPTAARRK